MKQLLLLILLFVASIVADAAIVLSPNTDYSLTINGTLITITAPKVVPPVVTVPQVSTKFMSGGAGTNLVVNNIVPPFPTHSQDGTGAIRIGVGFSHANYDDPIVFPKKPGASHAHAFFGNTTIDAYSDLNNIVNVGTTTSNMGIGNRSAYWIPMILDSKTNTFVKPIDNVVYYKSGYHDSPIANIQPIPKGLRMIVGDAKSLSPKQWDYTYSWSCINGNAISGGGLVMTNCPKGSMVNLQIKFNQCWDGKNIDSADHKSHMSDLAYINNKTICPATHPVMIPQITYNVKWLVDSVDSSTWKLSSDMGQAGTSAHADYAEGLSEVVRQNMVVNCVRAKDCGGI
jgi:Domain of unknown function (DUF1996)